MTLEQPWWLLLALPLAWLAWKHPRWGLRRPLRAAVLAVLLITMANPHCQRLRDGLDLWVLVDQSESAANRITPLMPEWFDLLQRSRRGPQDRIHVIDFAASALSRAAADFQPFTDERGETRIANAIESALALRDPDVPARLLLFSDGFSTEPVEPALESLLRAEVPLDLRLLGEPTGDDLWLDDIRMPQRVGIGEPFLLEIEVAGRPDGPVPLEIRRDGRLIASETVIVSNGRARARFSERLTTPGASRYDIAILPETDAEPGNNRDTRWIEVEGGHGVLLLTSYQDDPLAPLIQQLGAHVEVVTDPGNLHPGRLSGARLVVFNNVPAHEIPADFLQAIDFHVRHQGGSLLMAGGRHSFGGGGYFESPIDPLLPVSMELRTDQRRGMVALGIVMDRSGSMNATVAGGRTKMDLANEGAANAIDMLGDGDQVAVWAVDTSPHPIVPLQMVGPQRAVIDNAVRRIASQGGGIYVYEGLSAAWEELRHAPVPSRPIILFSDAADSEQPGDYRDLIATLTADGGTVSVIALGTRADKDARLLEDIADRGNGRVYFTDRAEDIPNLFSQEIVAVARSTYLEEPVGLTATGGWRELADESPQWPAQVDSYNLNYPRDWATNAVLADDEYATPLIAFGRRGLGRTAVIGTPLGGEGSATLRQWPGYGDTVQSLARWLIGEAVPPGMAVRARLDGSRLTVGFWHDDRWRDPLTAEPPRLWLARGDASPSVDALAWRRMNPGEMRAELDLAAGEMVRGVVQAGGHTLPFGPLVVGSGLEWDYDPRRLSELRTVAARSGGRELLDLTEAWEQPPVPTRVSIRPWFLIALLGLMLAEALATRLSLWLNWRELAASLRLLPRPRTAKPAVTSAPDPAPSAPAAPQPAAARRAIDPEPAAAIESEPPPSDPPSGPARPPDPPPSTEQRRATFARAKRRR